MHKLIEYVCDELEKLEKKVDKSGELSMAEIEYLDTLAHTKKNLIKAEEMSDDYSHDYSYEDRRGVDRGSNYTSYARGRNRNVRRDSMGRYSNSNGKEDMIEQLEDIMHFAPNDSIRKEVEKLIGKIEMS